MIDRLFETITARKAVDPASSYSAKLLAQGRNRISQKLGEEAIEAVIAATAGDTKALVGESADLLYHLCLLWVDAGITPAMVADELARREAMSGLAEKASRKE
jgi:phosphoribosyl-ATP pyrophosphohydrolase